jgi:hypothetical protein
MIVNFGELSAPLILVARRQAPRPPYGDGTVRPKAHSRLLPRAIVKSRQFLLKSAHVAWLLLRGAVCSPSLKAGDLRATHPCSPFGGHHPMSGADKAPSEPPDLPIKSDTTDGRPGSTTGRFGRSVHSRSRPTTCRDVIAGDG